MKNIVLALCLVSGASFASAAPVNKTADTQMQGTTNDVEITRKIRDRLTSDDSLSSSAQNVTIVTLGNSITLKGNVDKKDEISKINNVAQEFAAGKLIRNELKVVR